MSNDLLKQLESFEQEIEKRKISDPLAFINLYPKQQDFVDSYHKIIMFFAGNRAGKSFSGAYKAVKLALYEGKNGWVISPSSSTQKEAAQKTLMDILPRERITKIIQHQGVFESIILDNGATIGFRTSDQGRERLQGASIYWAWFDEEPKSEDIYREVKARTIDQDGIVFFTMTPLNGLTWTYDNFYLKRDDEPDRIKVIQASLYDNIFLPANAVKEMERDCAGDERQVEMRIYGNFTLTDNAVYPQFKEDVHVIKELPMTREEITVKYGNEYKVDKHINYIYGHSLDPGATHATGGVFIAIDETQDLPVFYVIDEYFANSDEDTKEHADIIKNIMGKNKFRYMYIDQAAKQERINYRREGLKYDPCVKRSGNERDSVGSGLSLVRQLLRENRLFILNHNRNLVHEMNKYQYDDRGNIVKLDDDVVDALRYFIISYITRNPTKRGQKRITSNRSFISTTNTLY